MARSFYVNGPTLVKVKFGDHLSGINISAGTPIASGGSSTLCELGLSQGPIKITPKVFHRDIHADDFGRGSPVEIITNCAEVNIEMQLVHFDSVILNVCLAESMGGIAFAAGTLIAPLLSQAGVLSPGGSLQGGNKSRLQSGWHFISLNLTSPVAAYPWRFLNSYMPEQPLVFPLGTEKSVVACNWRAITYFPVSPIGKGPEPISSGYILYDQTLDT